MSKRDTSTEQSLRELHELADRIAEDVEALTSSLWGPPAEKPFQQDDLDRLVQLETDLPVAARLLAACEPLLAACRLDPVVWIGDIVAGSYHGLAIAIGWRTYWAAASTVDVQTVFSTAMADAEHHLDLTAARAKWPEVKRAMVGALPEQWSVKRLRLGIRGEYYKATHPWVCGGMSSSPKSIRNRGGAPRKTAEREDLLEQYEAGFARGVWYTKAEFAAQEYPQENVDTIRRRLKKAATERQERNRQERE